MHRAISRVFRFKQCIDQWCIRWVTVWRLLHESKVMTFPLGCTWDLSEDRRFMASMGNCRKMLKRKDNIRSFISCQGVWDLTSNGEDRAGCSAQQMQINAQTSIYILSLSRLNCLTQWLENIWTESIDQVHKPKVKVNSLDKNFPALWNLGIFQEQKFLHKVGPRKRDGNRGSVSGFPQKKYAFSGFQQIFFFNFPWLQYDVFWFPATFSVVFFCGFPGLFSAFLAFHQKYSQSSRKSLAHPPIPSVDWLISALV